MYCKNFGNELNEQDKFCSTCEFKISSDFQDNSPIPTHNNKLTKIKKYFIAIIFLIAFPIVLYSISLSEDISIIDFITDPRGLTAVVSSDVGSAAGTIIFFLPLLYGMKKIQITKRTYIPEAFFIITILYEMVIGYLVIKQLVV